MHQTLSFIYLGTRSLVDLWARQRALLLFRSVSARLRPIYEHLTLLFFYARVHLWRLGGMSLTRVAGWRE